MMTRDPVIVGMRLRAARSVRARHDSYRDDMARGLVSLESRGVRWRAEEVRCRCVEILRRALYGEVASQ